MATERNAPRFLSHPSDFNVFFEDVNELGKRAKLDNAAKIKWAIRYAGPEGEAW